MKKKSKKPKVTKKPENPTLYIKYRDSEHGGEICEGEENDPYPSHERKYYDYSYDFATRTFPTGNTSFGRYKSLTVEPEVFSGDKIFLAIVIYSDGDTFGSSSGHHEIIGGFSTRKEAEELLSHVTKDGYDNRPEGFYPWNGYFSSLEGKTVIKLDIED
jgi:hypothetical protein